MIIDCAHYRDGHRQQEGQVSLEEAAASPSAEITARQAA